LLGGRRCDLFHEIISLENLFCVWKEFRKGKRKKSDVAYFEANLEDNLFRLHAVLSDKTYTPDEYSSFFVADPKLRHIHKATIRDRVLHQAVFRVLYEIFDPKFIFDSYSSRNSKGIHAGFARLVKFSKQISSNYRKPSWVLKCDIKKFFDSIDHEVLLNLIFKSSKVDCETRWSVTKIINSFEKAEGKGLPLGNVTSQLFANIYLNKLDQFVKHKLKQKCYIRYCDDFVILAKNKEELVNVLLEIQEFLSEKLLLNLHEGKVNFRKLQHGIDFLGYINLPHYTVLRTKTKRRVYKKVINLTELLKAGKISEEYFNNSVQSYLGILTHCKGEAIRHNIANFSC